MLARAWRVAPSALRDCTVTEAELMVLVLNDEAKRR